MFVYSDPALCSIRACSDQSEAVKKSKGATGQAAATPASLEPFYFLLTSSPKYWASAYEGLTVWMQKSINREWQGEPEPLQVPNALLASTCPTHAQWQSLLAELGHSERIEVLWSKFTIVDKLLTLFGDEHWNERNLGFFALQHRLWWISTVQPWFSVSQVRTCQEYLQVSLSALVLELWFRFVWARHTQRIYLARAPQLQPEVTNNSSDDLSVSSDDILDPSELGEGSESESASVADSSFEDTADESDIYNRDEINKYHGFFSGAAPEPMDITEEDEEGETTEESSASPHQLPQLHTNSLISEHMQVAASNPSVIVESSAEGTTWLDEIPPATSLFFAHPHILRACELIEQHYWSTGIWDCQIAFDKLLRLTEDRNADMQLPEQSSSQVEAQLEHAYNKIMVPFLQDVGVLAQPAQADDTKSRLTGLPLCWTFDPSFGDYWVDTILEGTFSNLTNGGIAPAVHFIGLFPHLLLIADSKADAQVSRVYQDTHAKLVAKGTITPQLEGLIATLDSLSLERASLLRQNQKFLRQHRAAADPHPSVTGANSEPEDLEALPSDIPTNSVEGRLHGQRLARIRQIDIMIGEIKEELNHLTGAIDRIESKKKRKTKGETALALSNFLGPVHDTPHSLPSDADLWGLPSLNPPQ